MDNIPVPALEAGIIAGPVTGLALLNNSSDLMGAAMAGGQAAVAFYAANMLIGAGGSVVGQELNVSALSGALAGGFVYFRESDTNTAVTTALVVGGLAYVGSAFLLPAVNRWRSK